MRTVHHSLAMAAAAALTLTGNVAAQEKPSAILNTLEVRQLVARAEPADNAQLSAHFAALADRYAAEARRHTAMSQSFVGNPTRNLGTGMSVHCKRLADLNTQEAASLRELATYHHDLAGGAAATPPARAARYQRGAGAQAPTDKELAELAAKASTPADHHALEEYFRTLAGRYEADAKEHASFAGGLRTTRLEQAAAIHSQLATLSRDAAKEANAAAEMHKQLASVAR
jgi:hypothetical protein